MITFFAVAIPSSMTGATVAPEPAITAVSLGKGGGKRDRLDAIVKKEKM